MYIRWIGLTLGLTVLLTTAGLWLDHLRQDFPVAQAFADVKPSANTSQKNTVSTEKLHSAGPSQIIQVQSSFVITGAVQRPGKYTLPVGSTLAQLVAQAGGLLPAADIAARELLRPLGPAEIVLIPTARQPQAATSSSQHTAEPVAQPTTLIHLNRATASQLQSLKGVGPALAARILQHRQQHGLFQRLEDLTQVKGIGAKRLEKWRKQLRL